MNRFLKAVFILFLSFCITGMLYICLIFCVIYNGYKDIDTVKVQTIVSNLKATENGYELEGSVQNQLKQAGNFAMLLDKNGHVVWSLNKPAEVPEDYSLKDVAAFSRWYLYDYPAFSWEYEEGLVVLCMPKNTMWKYNMLVPESEVTTIFFVLMPIWIVSLLTIYLVQEIFNRAARAKRDAARTEWIAGVSHDLRTPLTTIMGYSDNLCKEKLPENLKAEAQAIRQQSERVAVLMEEFNLFNRLQFGEKTVKKMEIKPAVLLRKIIAEVLNGDFPEQYEIEVDLERIEEVRMKANEELLSRAFLNLIRNSMVHNPEECKITVSGEVSGRHVIITIADNGKGYPESICRTGFRKSDYLNMHGFGLTIVHRIITAHQGTVKFSNHSGAVTKIKFKCHKTA